jgi:hypothetical protein
MGQDSISSAAFDRQSNTPPGSADSLGRPGKFLGIGGHASTLTVSALGLRERRIFGSVVRTWESCHSALWSTRIAIRRSESCVTFGGEMLVKPAKIRRPTSGLKPFKTHHCLTDNMRRGL